MDVTGSEIIFLSDHWLLLSLSSLRYYVCVCVCVGALRRHCCSSRRGRVMGWFSVREGGVVGFCRERTISLSRWLFSAPCTLAQARSHTHTPSPTVAQPTNSPRLLPNLFPPLCLISTILSIYPSLSYPVLKDQYLFPFLI